VLRNGGFQLGGQKRPGGARERRREWLTTIVATTQEKEKEEGRERRDQDRCKTQKLGGEGVPIDVGTGGVRGSDERGDRKAEERHKRVQT
jgi:hypothetical protein